MGQCCAADVCGRGLVYGPVIIGWLYSLRARGFFSGLFCSSFDLPDFCCSLYAFCFFPLTCLLLSLHMEFAVHRLLPLYHCPFYTCLHFIHLIPPSPLPPTCLVPWFPSPSTRPLLLLQPRAMPGLARRASSVASSLTNGESTQGEESRKALTSTTTSETAEATMALKAVGGGGAGESSVSSEKAGSSPTEVPWLPFLVYRCFTATLKVHPFPPPHVSLIEFQGIKLPAVLQVRMRLLVFAGRVTWCCCGGLFRRIAPSVPPREYRVSYEVDLFRSSCLHSNCKRCTRPIAERRRNQSSVALTTCSG